LFLCFIDWDSLNLRKRQAKEHNFTEKEFEETFLVMCNNDLNLLRYYENTTTWIYQIMDFINYQIERNDFWEKMKQIKEKLDEEKRKELIKSKQNLNLSEKGNFGTFRKMKDRIFK